MAKENAAKKDNAEVAAEEVKTKTCFVIMPISDIAGYDSGHFKRVYHHIIKPACLKAGFEPVRADDVYTTNHIVIDILQRIINADMAICDLSAKNPNVLYELGIRQAFNLPVTLIKDNKTDRIFDISSLRDIEYDVALRIDKTEEIVPVLAEALTSTFENKDDSVNSIIQLLGIQSAEIKKTEISQDTSLLLDAINNLGNRIDKIENRTSARIINTKPHSSTWAIKILSKNTYGDAAFAFETIQNMLPSDSEVRTLNLDDGFKLLVKSNSKFSPEFENQLYQKLTKAGLTIDPDDIPF